MARIYDQLSYEQLQAIEQFMARTVFPLIHDSKKGLEIRGTGSFYAWKGKTYLITAAHVLDGIDISNFGIPAKPIGKSRIRTFDGIDIYKPNVDDFDIAVVGLQDGLFVQEVVREWNVLRVENNYRGVLGKDAEFLLAGFPAESVHYVDDNLAPKSLFQFYTVAYEGAVDGSRGIHDLLMLHKKVVKNSENVEIEMVQMLGASGSPIWKIDSNDQGIWTPERCLKLVGVQSAYKPGSYIRAKSWNIVSEMFQHLDKLHA